MRIEARLSLGGPLLTIFSSSMSEENRGKVQINASLITGK